MKISNIYRKGSSQYLREIYTKPNESQQPLTHVIKSHDPAGGVLIKPLPLPRPLPRCNDCIHSEYHFHRDMDLHCNQNLKMRFSDAGTSPGWFPLYVFCSFFKKP